MNQKPKYKEYDACIIGAGIAGIFLAWLLGSKGKKVLILEKNAKVNMNGADILKPSGINILEKYGLLQELLNKECRIRDQLGVFYNGIHVNQIDYKAENERGYFMVCPYSILLEVIYDKIKKIDTIELLVNQSFSKINEAKKGVYITLKSGEEIYCPLLIGADGTQSMVREYADIKAHINYYDHVMYFNKYPITSSVEELNRLYIDQDGGLAYFYPINNKEARCVLGFNIKEGKALKESENRENLISRLRKFVTHSDDMLNQIDSLDNFLTFPLCSMHSEQYFKGKIILLGNAAHSIHPVTGQGMNLAVEDTGELFIWLSKYFDGEISLEEALSSYKERRFELNSKILAYGHRLASSFGNETDFMNSLNSKIQTSSRDPSIFNNI
ncbi:FAD-dependent monooxygenase [Chryseobacterium sp. G0201]|uniref:FAD-dependent monooxygenase n=1 Tax=Chryseobacterium sp. G0201 TaxID=2487065 RepID=UPI000F4EB30C|nr:FAD-dependent monooxygenase [Chryseobacterium sp. G0201]AZA53946.1 hypothetical protein EG348_13515 [Chryseobacterium sp. G0201]